ncbi:MAG TPA: acyl-CoA dehydrogenase family protein, partial [Thermoleophilaceae bacterium]|nr:acyl-CoA dehydrogenase family protein [Thermoleophilaceae bacterium]
MNFDFTDDQQAIKATAREFLADRFRPERVRELAEAGRYDHALWREMAELGWPGIFIDEDHGGQGLGMVELVILLEELGYALAPAPFLSNAAAGLLIAHAGSDAQRERLLPGIASGAELGAAGIAHGGSALVADAPEASAV